MKRTLALTLAAIFIASVLTACGEQKNTSAAISANVRVTSSDGESAAAWLTDRLGDKLSDRIVIGTSADGYGVDVSALESDGYIIRNLGGEVALFARTTDGLDRAVRKYAQTVEAGCAVGDVTYHEGYRVKSLTVCGEDVSAFAVVTDDGADEAMQFAASELAKYIRIACGAELCVYGASEFEALGGDLRPIRLTVNYPALGDEAFRITVTADGITIAGGRYRGCLYGAYDLLEDIGWRFVEGPVTGSDSLIEYLYEAESVDLTPALDREEHGAVGYRCIAGVASREANHDIAAKYRKMDVGSENGYAKHGQFGLFGHTCHGINSFKGQLKAEGLWNGGQPCYSDPDVIDIVKEEIRRSTNARLDAGQEIGKDFVTFDVSHDDNGDFCQCKRCEAIKREEGALSGVTLRFANEIGAMLAEEYPGTWAATFEYSGTTKPPAKTRPLDNVRVAFCLYVDRGWILCTAHDGTGKDCPANCSNRITGEQLDGWAEMCTNDNLEIWYYPFIVYGQGFGCPIFTGEYETLRSIFSGDYPLSSMMICSGDGNGVHQESLAIYLCTKFMWEGANITREDYDAYIREWFEICYGGAADYMLAYFDQIEIAGQTNGCWISFHDANYKTVNNDYVAEHFDGWWELYLAAKRACASAKEEELVERYMAGMMYISIGITYNDRYTNGTEAERAVIAERYTEMHRIFRKYNLRTFDDYITREYAPETLDLEQNPFDAFLPETHWDAMPTG